MIHAQAIGPFDLDKDERIVAEVDVAAFEAVSIVAQDGAGSVWWTGGNAVLAVRWRPSPSAAPVDFASAQSLTGDGSTIPNLDVSAVRSLVLVVTTALANVRGRVYLTAKNTRLP